jgi:hypothetical protein
MLKLVLLIHDKLYSLPFFWYWPMGKTPEENLSFFAGQFSFYEGPPHWNWLKIWYHWFWIRNRWSRIPLQGKGARLQRALINYSLPEFKTAGCGTSTSYMKLLHTGLDGCQNKRNRVPRRWPYLIPANSKAGLAI